MKIHPLKKYFAPAYPTRMQICDEPSLLETHTPAAWKILGRLSGLVTLMAEVGGCAHTDGVQPAASSGTRVAPIFAHGEGRGATGCVMVVPPVFLSEEEAMQIITEELGRVGIRNDDPSKVWQTLQQTKYKFLLSSPGEPLGKGEPIPFQSDFWNKEKKIVIEFVSSTDCTSLRETGGGIFEIFPTKQIAEELGPILEEQNPKFVFGAFYDPIERIDQKKYESELEKLMKPLPDPPDKFEKKTRQFDTQTRVESKRLLRQQVKDFIAWLEGQGVI